MTIEELLSTCDLKVATEKQFKSCEAFACSNDDLNEFFANDALPYQNYLLGKTYMFCLKSNPNIILSAFTLSNDSIRLTNAVSENDKNSFFARTDLNQTNLKRYPSVLIGRLGVNKEFERKGYGSAIMDFIKVLFLTRNKTGCRFIM